MTTATKTETAQERRNRKRREARAAKGVGGKAKASKKTSKKASSKKAPPSMPEKGGGKPANRKQVDLGKLTEADKKKRLAAVYKLEGEIEKRRAVYDASKKTTASHKKALASAEAALDKELDEQRFGPGPLFNEDGTGPA